MTAVEAHPASGVAPGATHCRFCGRSLELTLVDLGKSPLCQTVLSRDELESAETFYPLHARVCEQCWLVQIAEFVSPRQLFSDYTYFSSYSDSWVAHARSYAETMTERLSLGPSSLVVELASNDGYLLQHFREESVPVLGIDPAANVAVVAEQRGVPTVVDFFGVDLARRLAASGQLADLVVGNNVLAQVPDINDFVAGVSHLLAPGGTATFEFPHLLSLIEHVEYDTIYHEHFSYFSLFTIRAIFEAHGLTLSDVETLQSHGGSLRAFFRHADELQVPSPAVESVLAAERDAGLLGADGYARFADRVRESKRALLELLIGLRRAGMQVAGYGAPGKGNTLLNYCGIRTDLIEYTVDRNPVKQGAFTPGTHIPIHAPERIAETRPDAIVILAWNLAREISAQLAYTAEWGARLILPITATSAPPVTDVITPSNEAVSVLLPATGR